VYWERSELAVRIRRRKSQNAADSQMPEAESAKAATPRATALIAAIFYVVAEIAWGPFHSTKLSNNGIGQNRRFPALNRRLGEFSRLERSILR
jgi:hypothetical protein